MIRNRLAALMGERGLKITRVAKDTGISRNTITSISQNDSEMFRMETINTLCKYFGITPCDFFEYEPVDFNFSVYMNNLDVWFEQDFIMEYIHVDNIDMDVLMDIDVNENQETLEFDLKCSLVASRKYDLEESIDSPIVLKIEFDGDKDKNLFEDEIYKKINTSFRQDIYKLLINTIIFELKNNLIKAFNNSSINLDIKKRIENKINSELIIELQSDIFRKF